MEKQLTANMGRRQFLGAAATALFAGVAVQILGCDNSPTATTSPVALTGNIIAPDEANHPVPGQHIATITQAQLNSGAAMTLNIQGNADHNHTVSLTAQDMANVKAGGAYSQESTVGEGHTHTVTFNS
jgi:hypothetical protein